MTCPLSSERMCHVSQYDMSCISLVLRDHPEIPKVLYVSPKEKQGGWVGPLEMENLRETLSKTRGGGRIYKI